VPVVAAVVVEEPQLLVVVREQTQEMEPQEL
jgi:hypothetical protein